RAFSILDLGCGDAATFAPLLEGLPIKSYRGVDLSEPALTLARKNLSDLACWIDLVQADFMSALGQAEPVDAIYTSFALHHLSCERKGEFFRLSAQKLERGGLLLVADVRRREGESLPDYHRNYCDWLRATMTVLADSELDGICDHLVNNDFPEPAPVLHAQAEAAGLRALEGAEPHQWHALMVFAKD
ncbi:MAG TPA: class I SAM-dependent methyltransferase, partial [Methylocystis sp.]|nr:class I SAM-dependent methyltransferase [Methylocystis sp.]